MSTALIDMSTWSVLKEQAALMRKSGFLPESIKSDEQAIAIAAYGREIGIGMMTAFQQISVIKGKPAMGAQLMLSQIYKHCPGAKVEILEHSETKATIVTQRPGEMVSKPFEFSIEDAKRAQLTGKSSWQQYPKNMLLWRAISNMARAKYPDCLMGISYTPEELGAEVNNEGEIIDLPREIKPLPSLAPSTAHEEMYEGSDEQQKRLETKLKDLKIDESLWAGIASHMVGKPMKSSTIAASLTAAMAEKVK